MVVAMLTFVVMSHVRRRGCGRRRVCGEGKLERLPGENRGLPSRWERVSRWSGMFLIRRVFSRSLDDRDEVEHRCQRPGKMHDEGMGFGW